MRLADLRALAERFAADHLTEHVAELRHSRRNPGRKEINDPLWGTIGLSGAECAVIDSPLVQRLRLVRQLGVVHWVYPGAVHTRFEHTLGVLRQVQHLSTAINALGVQQGQGEIIDRSRVHLLRLAAILHDVGHGAFSHVSEHALSALPDFEPIASEFALSQKAERRSLSEIFAYYAVLSPAMRELIEVLLDNDGQYIVLDQRREANVDAIQEKLGRLIIGQSVDHDVPLLHELISGPFDADKLDYFVRDAKAAGTPSLLDISRLIQKLAVRSLTSDNLPPAIARSVDRRDRHTLVGMKWSGISVLDELHLSRVLLYAKIYRHPKVMAIEEMVAGALTLLAGASGAERVLELVYRRNDDELLSMTHEAFESALLDAEPKPEESARIAGAARILKRLRLRKLFMKAFQLQRTYPGDPLAQVENQKYGLIEFREEIEKPSGRERFRQLLVAEVSKIHGMLGNVSRTQVELDGAIRIRALGPTPGGAQIGRAWLLPSAGKPIEFRDYMVNRTIWADSYLSDQPAGYVFCESELTDAVYIATERLLRDRYSVLLPDAALESSKRDADAIQDMKRRLKTAGYYQDAPFDVRPVPRIMARASVGASISTFIPKLTRYQAPDITEDPARTSRAAATASWLRQFDDDDDIDCASVLLDHLRILDRSDTTTAVRRFLETRPEFEGATIVPFGSARDSSAIQSYFAGDLRGKGIAECKTLDEAIRSGSSTRIIFLDDFVGSGGQSSDVLAAGFGRKDLRRDLGEDRDLFSSDIQTFLRSAPLAFVFTAAWDSGLEEVRRITAELGLDTKVFGHLGEDEIPFAPAILNEARPDHAAAFLERSKLLGTRLLDSTAKQKPDESAEARAERLAERGLGYGNRGMLLASPFNVPTQTFTPLWASGTLNGVEWRALMQRRQK